MTDVHTHELVEGPLFGYNEKCSFGLLMFDATSDDPYMKYQIINIDGETVHELTIKRSALRSPTSRIQR
ncbi:MAG TPA: hypothetical protein VGK58_20715 [Lacipirellulaceae bacterium]